MRIRSLATITALALLLAIGCGNDRKRDCDADQDDDFELAPNSSLPHRFAVADGLLFFQAIVAGGEPVVWSYDGQREPKVVEELRDAGVIPGQWPAAFDDYYYFPGYQAGEIDLWRTDGVRSERVVLWPGQNGGDPRFLTPFDGDLYFSGDDGVVGRELWKIDTRDAVTLAADLLPGAAGSSPFRFNVFDDLLLFNAVNFRLWDYGGLGPRLLTPDLVISISATFDGLLYFAAFNRAIQSPGLYAYSGVALPFEVADLDVRGLTVFRSLLHVASDAGSFWTLGAWDGVGPMQPIFDSDPFTSIVLLGVFDNALHFASGGQIWRYNGVSPPAPVARWTDPAVLPEVVVYDDVLYYRGRDERGIELWSFDGRRDRRVADLYPGKSCQVR